MDRSEGNNRIAETNSGSNDIKHYLGIGKVFTYYFRKKDPNRKRNINLKMMHGVNKISIIMFIIALIVMLTRRLMY